jgi:mono/diheme cytochrome c family protein
MQITSQALDRGRERYDIYCSPCHGATGDGNGIVIRRGFPTPPSYHIPRLRNAPAGHFFDVMTRGYGVMYSYASRVTPEDRWAIAAYIRALQLSQDGTLSDVPANEMARLKNSP